MQIYHANIVYSAGRDKLSVRENSYIGVENGIVEGIWEQLPECMPARR